MAIVQIYLSIAFMLNAYYYLASAMTLHVLRTSSSSSSSSSSPLSPTTTPIFDHDFEILFAPTVVPSSSASSTSSASPTFRLSFAANNDDDDDDAQIGKIMINAHQSTQASANTDRIHSTRSHPIHTPNYRHPLYVDRTSSMSGNHIPLAPSPIDALKTGTQIRVQPRTRTKAHQTRPRRSARNPKAEPIVNARKSVKSANQQQQHYHHPQQASSIIATATPTNSMIKPESASPPAPPPPPPPPPPTLQEIEGGKPIWRIYNSRAICAAYLRAELIALLLFCVAFFVF